MVYTDKSDNRLGTLLGTVPWISVLVWGALLLAVYALHELFFVILTTFLLSFIVRRMVVALVNRLRPGQESPGLERWLTLVCFAAIALVAWVVFSVLGPRFIEQGHVMFVKAQNLRPADTLSSLLSRTVGAYLFQRTYGGPEDPRYQRAFSDYQVRNRHGEGALAAFARMQSDLEIGFELHYERTERQRLSDELLRSGTGSGSRGKRRRRHGDGLFWFQGRHRDVITAPSQFPRRLHRGCASAEQFRWGPSNGRTPGR